MTLTARDQKILTFEQVWWQQAGAKDAAILHKFGVTPARYHQMLETVLRAPDALAAEPRLVKALLASRDKRAEMRRNHVLGLSATRTATLDLYG